MSNIRVEVFISKSNIWADMRVLFLSTLMEADEILTPPIKNFIL